MPYLGLDSIDEELREAVLRLAKQRALEHNIYGNRSNSVTGLSGNRPEEIELGSLIGKDPFYASLEGSQNESKRMNTDSSDLLDRLKTQLRTKRDDLKPPQTMEEMLSPKDQLPKRFEIVEERRYWQPDTDAELDRLQKRLGWYGHEIPDVVKPEHPPSEVVEVEDRNPFPGSLHEEFLTKPQVVPSLDAINEMFRRKHKRK